MNLVHRKSTLPEWEEHRPDGLERFKDRWRSKGRVLRESGFRSSDLMGNKKTVRITIQQRERITISGSHPLTSAWCIECGAEVPMATGEQSALLAGLTSREIYRRVEEASLHFTETPDGQLFICLNSLFPEGHRQITE
jgi:hypothetical protein